MRRPVQSPRGGFSLTELTMSLLLLGSMVLLAGMALDRCLTTLRQHRAEQQVIANAGRTLQRITRELEFAGLGGMTPKIGSPYDSETLTFRVCQGYDEDASAIDWGASCVLRFEYEPGEADDGDDDDGDGLIDEGLLVQVENEGTADEQRLVLARGVSEFLQGETQNGDDDNGNGLIDEQGLSFSFAAEVVTIRLSLQAPGPGGVVITKTLETAISVRN